MILIKPVDSESADDDWSGSINKVVAMTQRSMDSLKKEMKKSMGKMQSEILGGQKASQGESLACARQTLDKVAKLEGEQA